MLFCLVTHFRGIKVGFASYREDDLFRFLDATTNVPDPSEALPQRYRCPFCAESFEDQHTLSAHLSARHRGDRPVLMIAGREPDRVSTIRQPLPTSEIVLVEGI